MTALEIQAYVPILFFLASCTRIRRRAKDNGRLGGGMLTDRKIGDANKASDCPRNFRDSKAILLAGALDSVRPAEHGFSKQEFERVDALWDLTWNEYAIVGFVIRLKDSRRFQLTYFRKEEDGANKENLAIESLVANDALPLQGPDEPEWRSATDDLNAYLTILLG
jgi:hypothetical protein